MDFLQKIIDLVMSIVLDLAQYFFSTQSLTNMRPVTRKFNKVGWKK